MMKSTRRFLLLLAFISVIFIGMVFGSFYSQLFLVNELSVEDVQIKIVEEFNQSDQWVPGEAKEKIAWFENYGQIPVLLRFRIENPVWSVTGIDEDMVVINYHESTNTDWQKIGDWYYYTSVLLPGAVTLPVLDSVTFSTLLTNQQYEALDIDVSDEFVDINIILQAIQVDSRSAEQNWGVNVSISGLNVSWY